MRRHSRLPPSFPCAEQDPLTDVQITTAALPPLMLHAGVRRLDFYVVQMWRPRCLATLSSHHQDETDFASSMASRHRKLLAAGIPTLVVSYADLLWAPHRVIARVKAFVPCGASRLRKMSTRFEPRLGVDVFVGNHLKEAHTGSLASYAVSHPPHALGYDNTTRTCPGDVVDLPEVSATTEIKCLPHEVPSKHCSTDGVDPTVYLRAYSQ